MKEIKKKIFISGDIEIMDNNNIIYMDILHVFWCNTATNSNIHVFETEENVLKYAKKQLNEWDVYSSWVAWKLFTVQRIYNDNININGLFNNSDPTSYIYLHNNFTKYIDGISIKYLKLKELSNYIIYKKTYEYHVNELKQKLDGVFYNVNHDLKKQKVILSKYDTDYLIDSLKGQFIKNKIKIHKN